MSIGKRIKDRRVSLGISRADLAKTLSVSLSAISNYENGIGTPTVENVCKLLSALNCDANYLFQDEMKNWIDEHEYFTLDEMEAIKKYRSLSEYGKRAVRNTLQNEYERDHDGDVELTVIHSEVSGKNIHNS